MKMHFLTLDDHFKHSFFSFQSGIPLYEDCLQTFQNPLSGMEGTSNYEKLKAENTVLDHVSLKRKSTGHEYVEVMDKKTKYVNFVDDHYDTMP